MPQQPPQKEGFIRYSTVILHSPNIGCPKMDLGFIHPFLSPYDFNSDLEGCYKEGLYENLNGKAYGSENALQKEEILDIGHPVY